jgi:hypothetical protein
MVESVGGLGGFFKDGMRWQDYAARNPGPHYEALRLAIVERGLKRGGDWHQNSDDGCPVFSDGTSGTFTYRAWGDLLAAVWSEHEGRDYSYMDFYMDGWGAAEATP